MAEEPDGLVLQLLRAGTAARFDGIESAIGFAANASRAHVDLRKQVADLTRRREARGRPMRRATELARLEGATMDGVAVTERLAYWRTGHGAKGQ